jgi:hypothetical protein
MYTEVLPELVMPVKYAFGKNVRISSVPGKMGMVKLVEVTTTALDVAAAAVVPNPKKTVLEPWGIMMRYWLAPGPNPETWTGVGAVVLAVNTTVLPIGEKA